MTDREQNNHQSVQTSRYDDWKQVLQFTEQMFQAAQKEEWDKLEKIEEERHKLLYIYFSSMPDVLTEQILIKQIIQQMIALDRQVIILCQNGQQVLANKIQSLRIGNRAIQAYGS
ncbi:flagellar protein FliT [Gammaproteobacteria bacterium]